MRVLSVLFILLAGCAAHPPRTTCELARRAADWSVSRAALQRHPQLGERLERISADTERRWERTASASCGQEVAARERIGLCLHTVTLEQSAWMAALASVGREQALIVESGLATLPHDADLCLNPARYQEFDEALSDLDARRARELLARAIVDRTLEDARLEQTVRAASEAAERSPARGVKVYAALERARRPSVRSDRREEATAALALAEQARLDFARSKAQLLLAELMRERGELEPSAALAERALSLRGPLLGGDHAFQATAYMELGVLYAEMRDAQRSRLALERSLRIARASYPGEVGDSALHHEWLARAHELAQDWGAARGELQAALASLQRTGHEPAYGAFVHARLAYLALSQGDSETAQRELEDARRAVEPHSPGGERRAAVAHQYIASVLAQQGRDQEALAHNLRSLELHRTTLGEHAPTTAELYMRVARGYRQVGNRVLALPIARVAVERAQELWGEQHDHTAQALLVLASVQSWLLDRESALASAQRAYTIARDLHGELSSEAQICRAHIDALCTRQHYAPACELTRVAPRSPAPMPEPPAQRTLQL